MPTNPVISGTMPIASGSDGTDKGQCDWRKACETDAFRGTIVDRIRRIVSPPSPATPRALAARQRARKPWHVYLIACRSGAIYTGIARDVAARYAQHVAGTGARYTRANPPVRLLVKFRCANQSEASRMEAAIKRLGVAEKRKLVGATTASAKKALLA